MSRKTERKNRENRESTLAPTKGNSKKSLRSNKSAPPKGSGKKEYYKMIFGHMAIDFATVTAAFWLSFLLCYFVGWNQNRDKSPIAFAGQYPAIIYLICSAITLIFMYLAGCGRSSFRYSSTIDVLRVAIGVAGACFVLSIFVWTEVWDYVRISFIAIFWFISVPLLCVVRYFNRGMKTMLHYIRRKNIVPTANKRVLVYGAGYVGRMLSEQLINNPNDGYIPVAIVDDDPTKHGMTISGLRVETAGDNLQRIVDKMQAELIIIAIQAISKRTLKELYQNCVACGIPVKIVPYLVDGKRELSTLAMEVRDVKTEELLGREEFEVNLDLMSHLIEDRVVLVTGGAGSIGSELCRQALQFGCKHLIVFDVTENSVFFLQQEFSRIYDADRFTTVVGSVRDKAKLKSTFERFRPDIVFHAAAYKHVPVMEFAPCEAVKNNIIGTANVIDACNAADVKRFILISTDKAVNPANVMGATKRIAEMIVQTRQKSSSTQLAAVRFGNVLGSAGSVVGIFLDQIRKGGPITLTHSDILRYFMTIPEACRLVMQAGALASRGEVFVLDMGEPVKIYDLAVDLIKMNGLVPEKDIEITVTGLRPGEKLFEELNYGSEVCDATMHEGIFVCKLADIDAVDFDNKLLLLKAAAENEDSALAIKRIFEIVPSAFRIENRE